MRMREELASKTEANDKYSDDLKSTKGELNKAVTKGNELAKEIEDSLAAHRSTHV